ncbi:MAG: hypothetical protein AMS23_02900 [Bacteroides sp. SM1_62]|nr:MAG: hypothetical protein AMS26_09565 [Bacteroides sp. SM23_62]KPL26165.1 MAG: hypothetical protein AMS23_02900 [Bacteroides sp. SM1_62]
MKHKLISPGSCLLLFFLLSCMSGCSSNLEKTRSFKTIFDHYRNKDGVVAIGFPPGLLSLVLDQDDPEQVELKGLMRELSSFSMLIIEEGSGTGDLKDDLGTVVTDFTTRNEFQDLFRLQSGGDDMFIRIQEKDGMVREAILMMNADENFTVIDLRGNIEIKHFTRLVEGGYLQELTQFSELDL